MIYDALAAEFVFDPSQARDRSGRWVSDDLTSSGPPTLRSHTFEGQNDPDAFRAALSLGYNLSEPSVRSLLAACAGAGEGHHVRFNRVGEGQLGVEAEGAGFRSWLVIRRSKETGGAVARLDLMENSQQASGRQGVEIFCGQVKALRKARVSHVFLLAAGDPGDRQHNGYYTWPRFGFRGQMTDSQFRKLPADIKKQLGGIRDVADLFAVEGGPAAWRSFGSALDCNFDLDPASRSSRSLERYVNSRKTAREASFAGDLPWTPCVWKLHEDPASFCEKGQDYAASARESPKDPGDFL